MNPNLKTIFFFFLEGGGEGEGGRVEGQMG